MKLGGKTISIPQPELIIIPRGDEDFVFTAKAVIDYTEFDRLCPLPTPPTIVKRNGEKSSDVNDRKYLERVSKHAKRRFAWMVLESLRATPGLEWDTVNYNDPDTWENYETELESSGLTQTEINEIMRGIMAANSMDADKFKQARDRFIRSQAEKA